MPLTCWKIRVPAPKGFLIAAIILHHATATAYEAQPLMVRSWTTADGLPQNSVQAIAQTPDGYLWLGTRGGLSRFDGVRFTNYGLADGLKSLNVRVLTGDGQGGLWIGTPGGLSHWQNGGIRTWTTADGLLHNEIYSLAAAGPGAVWVGSRLGLQHFGADGFRSAGEGEGLRGMVVTLATGAAGELWASIEAVGLFLVQPGRCERIDLEPAIGSPHPLTLLVDAAGDLWAGMGNGIVRRRHEGVWIEYNQTHGVPYSSASCMAAGAGGDIWFGSYAEGLHRFHAGRFQPVPGTEPSLRAVAVTGDGLLWAGTHIGGLNRLTVPQVKDHPLIGATALGEVLGLAEQPAGQFWVATWGSGLHRGPLDALQQVTGVPAVTKDPHLRGVLSTRSGIYLIGPRLAGRWDPETPEYGFSVMPTAALNSLCESPDGSVLVGGKAGILSRLEGGKLTPVEGGQFPFPIAAVVRGKGPGVWVATSGTGLYHWDAGKTQHWTTAEGLPADMVSSLHEDAEGTLWIGTGGGGLAWLKGGRLHHVDSRQGLLNDAICPILEDDEGRLWLGSVSGISRVSKTELFNVAEGRAAMIHPLALDESDGMAVAECTSGYSPAGLKSQSGMLLFSTARGVVEVDPKRFTAGAESPPPLRIEDMLLDGKPMLGETVPPGPRELEFRYTAFNFAKPGQLRFRHRLEGLNAAWKESGTERSARYALLPPGKYRFEVSAANADGRWSDPVAGIPFTVQPFFWETLWFRVGMILLLMAGGAAAVVGWARLRVHRAQEREQLARAEAESQQHLNEVAHLTRVATLGELSSALAHELNQPLMAIMSNAELARDILDRDKSSSGEMREILRDIIEDDQRAGDVISRLRVLLKKGKFHPQPLDGNEVIAEVLRLMKGDLTARGVTVATDLSAGLPALRADRVQLQQVLINLVLNARDAMAANEPGTRRLTIRTCEDGGGMVRISVADSGHGIATGAEEKIFEPYQTSKTEGLGLGLSLSRSILLAHGGRMWAENQATGGAVLYFTLPEWKKSL